MSNKIALLMFAATVLLVSSAMVSIPQANALTQSNTMRWISTASYGNSQVCGDHKCAPGEHIGWYNALWQSQKVTNGKIGSTYLGEDVMHKLAGSDNSKNTYKWNIPVNLQTTQKGYK
jgi:hypothetical protein